MDTLVWRSRHRHYDEPPDRHPSHTGGEQGAVRRRRLFGERQGGVCLSPPGPATNTVTGIARPTRLIPVVLTGQAPTHLIGDAFQEVDIVGITPPASTTNS
jgi:hypothetical protein